MPVRDTNSEYAIGFTPPLSGVSTQDLTVMVEKARVVPDNLRSGWSFPASSPPLQIVSCLPSLIIHAK